MCLLLLWGLIWKRLKRHSTDFRFRLKLTSVHCPVYFKKPQNWEIMKDKQVEIKQEIVGIKNSEWEIKNRGSTCRQLFGEVLLRNSHSSEINVNNCVCVCVCTLEWEYFKGWGMLEFFFWLKYTPCDSAILFLGVKLTKGLHVHTKKSCTRMSEQHYCSSSN